MSNIAINTSRLPIPHKLVKGQEFITMGTGNEWVPDNETLLAALTAAQAALKAANDSFEEQRQLLKALSAARDTALSAWNAAVSSLAAYTESATGGDADKILTTGFDVRSVPAPPQPVAQILNVKVSFTGMPGHSLVRWKRNTNAEAYAVSRSPEPITATSWENLATVTETTYEGNGTISGQKYWYRVAGVNKLGQGPWSEPALRPVM